MGGWHVLPSGLAPLPTLKNRSSSAVIQVILIKTSTSKEWCCCFCIDEGGNRYDLLGNILAINIFDIPVFVPVTVAGPGSLAKSSLALRVTREWAEIYNILKTAVYFELHSEIGT